MKMKKMISLMLALLLLAGVLAGCGNHNEPAADNNKTTTSGTTTDDTEEDTTHDEVPPETRMIVDIAGREIEIPYTVETCVTLGSAARLVTYAGGADKIIGLSDLEKQGDPGMPYCYVNNDHFASCTSVASGGSGNTVYDEALAMLDMDVIFYQTTDLETLDGLQNKIGVPVIAVYARNFYDADFYASLELIGDVLGTEDHAKTVIDAVKGWTEDLNNRTKDIPDEDKPTVYTGALGFSGAHGFEGTSANFPPFVAVNAKNVVDETGEKGTMLIDLEKVTAWDPDYLFLNPNSMYIVNDDYKVNASFYDNLTAVKEGRVYTMISYNYFATNQELAILDAYFVGCTIYPEAFADLDFNAKAEEIFNVMLGSDYLDVLEENGSGFGTVTIGE